MSTVGDSTDYDLIRSQVDSTTRGVLVVDREPSVRRLLEIALKNEGYEVYTAANRMDAINLIDSNWNRVNVVLMDVSLPGGDCTELLRDLRLLPPGIPVLFMSVELDPALSYALLDRLRGKGVCGLIAKPIRLPELFDVLNAAIENKPYQQRFTPTYMNYANTGDWTES